MARAAQAARPVAPYVRVDDRTYLVQAGQLHAFARSWATGREAAIQNVSDLNPNDPMGYGAMGPVPSLRTTRPSVAKLFRFYKDEGSFARFLDQVPEDTWAEGWTLSTKDEAWARSAEEIDWRLKLRARVEQADKWHLTGGLSLLYLNLQDNTSEPREEPVGVKDVLRLQVVPRTRISACVLEKDAGTGRVGEPAEWRFRTQDSQEVRAHWMRVIPFRQFPDPHSDWDGISLAARIFAPVVSKGNVLWAAVTSYVQRAAPLLVVKIREGIKPQQGDIDDIEDEVDLLQSHVTQKIITHNFDIVPLTGAAQLPNPLMFRQLVIRELSVITRIPAHVIDGSAAGELASSLEDTRRYHAYISRREENWATPEILAEWYERLATWGLTRGPVPDDLTLKWKPLGEPTAKEAMDIHEGRGRAIGSYVDRGIEPPKELVDYEPGKVPGNPQPRLPATFGAPSPPAAEAQEPDDAVLSPDQRIMVARVRRVEQSVEGRLRSAFDDYFDKWRPTLEAHLRLVATQESARDAKPRASLQLELDKALRDAVLQAHRIGAEIGAQETFQQMGRDPVRDLLRDPDIREFRTISKLRGREVAARITERIRGEIADGLTRGEGFSALRDRVERTYRDLARFEAERIARTEAMAAYNRGSELAMVAAGVKRFRWIAYPGADNGDPNGPCVVRAGRVFDVGDEDNTPPIHPQDRCTMQPIVEA